MGCLVSTTNFEKEASEPPQRKKSSNTSHSLLEEETVVKEVLSISETPKSKPSISKFSINGTSPKKPTFPNRFVKNPLVGLNSQAQSGDLSEDTSEICSSISEINDFADRVDDVSKMRNISPAKYRNRQVSRDRFVGNSPGRMRTQPSPSRPRSGPVVDANGHGNMRRIGSEVGQGRRSVSPATRLDRTNRSMSSPGRCPSSRRSTPGRSRTLEDDTINYRDRDAKLVPTNHESLENPLVSLECFIFL